MLHDDLPWCMPQLQPSCMPIASSCGFWNATLAWMRHKRQWQLTEDWHCMLPDGTPIVIPRGFVSDGASAPRLFWPLMPPAGPLLAPSLIHDFAYRYDYLWTHDGNGGYLKHREGAGRDYWDRLFHELGIELVGRNLFTLPAHRVMRLLGRKAWRDKRGRTYPELRPGPRPD